jgi:hypothetical protein
MRQGCCVSDIERWAGVTRVSRMLGNDNDPVRIVAHALPPESRLALIEAVVSSDRENMTSLSKVKEEKKSVNRKFLLPPKISELQLICAAGPLVEIAT